ncbi:hypothetical protein C8R47DRAFT_1077785 [Mycena vitilis]|nr:hypothetical protein C8R47DRAFT_1077785 [Mycena vitilis]
MSGIYVAPDVAASLVAFMDSQGAALPPAFSDLRVRLSAALASPGVPCRTAGSTSLLAPPSQNVSVTTPAAQRYRAKYTQKGNSKCGELANSELERAAAVPEAKPGCTIGGASSPNQGTRNLEAHGGCGKDRTGQDSGQTPYVVCRRMSDVRRENGTWGHGDSDMGRYAEMHTLLARGALIGPDFQAHKHRKALVPPHVSRGEPDLWFGSLACRYCSVRQIYVLPSESMKWE